MKSVQLALLGLYNFASAQEEKSCKALAMQGGGSMGAFEVGALWGLYFNDEDKSKYAYDVVTGVSAGAINTAAFSLFAPGDEENAIKFLSEEWQNMGGRDIYKEWKKIGGIADGVLN
jgi:predicted acylesterase/phospholipase RssA